MFSVDEYEDYHVVTYGNLVDYIFWDGGKYRDRSDLPTVNPELFYRVTDAQYINFEKLRKRIQVSIETDEISYTFVRQDVIDYILRERQDNEFLPYVIDRLDRVRQSSTALFVQGLTFISPTSIAHVLSAVSMLDELPRYGLTSYAPIIEEFIRKFDIKRFRQQILTYWDSRYHRQYYMVKPYLTHWSEDDFNDAEGAMLEFSIKRPKSF